MTERLLYGGAITCHLPEKGWRDVSSIRQVPDHQECWQDTEQRVLVVEIMEYQSQVEHADAALYFFQDLAQANGIQEHCSFTATHTPSLALACPLPASASVCSGSGIQKAQMGRDGTTSASKQLQEQIQWLQVELCVIRLPSVETDLLISLSHPISRSDTCTTEDALSEIFRQVITSFRIRDWSLFG
jgi:Ran-interacting Mog1 protein